MDEVSPGSIIREKVEIDSVTELVLRRLASNNEEEPWDSLEHGGLEIKGPLSSRELIYRPPIPDVKTDPGIEVEMRFWVHPNGTVDRVIPLRPVGTPALESAAADYLRQWRFKPLSEKEPQVETWGTAVIRFRGQ